jgi:predicted nucleic acid-binding protein
MVIVSDTSPIVCLAHVKHINLLQKLFEEVLVPPSVYNELLENDIIDSSFLQQNPFFQIKNPENTVLVKKLKEQLDIGESKAIALSIEEKPEYLALSFIHKGYVGNITFSKGKKFVT